MGISNLANSPIEFKLGTRIVKISNLNIKEFLSAAEVRIKQEYINNMQQVAAMLTGKEKIDYLAATTKDIPKKNKLGEYAMDWLKSIDGITSLLMTGLNKHQKLTEEEVVKLITGTVKEEVETLIQLLLGIEDVPADSATQDSQDSQDSQDYQKKT